MWLISIIGVYQIVKTSIEVQKNPYDIPVKPPVEINQRILNLSKNIT